MQIKRIVDISQPFAEDGFNNPAFDDGRVEVCMRHEDVGWNAEKIITATHCGTHIDAPLHKIEGGKSIDEYPLESFFGEAVIIDLYDKTLDEEITYEDVYEYDELISSGINVLLCTGWGEKKTEAAKDEYLYHSPWLGKSAAEYLVEKKVNAVGIDHFSIGGANPDNVSIPHEILLRNDVLIIEGLYLPKELLDNKIWLLSAFPIKVKDASGSLARAVAIEL